jgi:large subunit ribosomal protein L24
MLKLKVKKGDKVIVITGKDKGKQGDVMSVSPKENKAIISGINLAKKHQKPTRESEGGIISKEMPIHISNIALIDPVSGKATKVGFKILEDGKKVRVAKSSGEILDKEGKK